MSSIQPHRPNYGHGSRAGRQVARISDRTDVEIASTMAAAEVEAVHLDGLQAVSRRAMQGVALVSQLEQQLTQLVPMATSRLQAIGDMHALASAQVVSETSRRLR
ncbi:hypothetical protein [Nocardioides marmoraquaticus]